MALVIHETNCGPLCQHPSCWHSNRRIERNFPRVSPKVERVEDDLEELPTQKIYNILDDYGPEPSERCPSVQFHVKKPKPPPHPRSHSLPSLSGSLLSDVKSKSTHLHGTNPPWATPASLSLSPKAFQSPVSSAKPIKTLQPKPILNRIEIQEVFDIEDLHEDWKNTFLTRSCYVWVPTGKKSTKKAIIEEQPQGPRKIGVKDVTEEMVPDWIGKEREKATKFRVKRKRSPNFIGSNTPHFSRTQIDIVKEDDAGEKYINLLDLPRNMLQAVLDQLAYSDEITTEKVQDALLKVIPALSRDTTALSLASGTILRQNKVKLHNRFQQMQNSNIFEPKPMFYMDEINIPRYLRTPKANTTLQDELSLKNALKNNKVPSISLGLPELPSGYRYTQPFRYYKGELYNFTLEAVTSPPHIEFETAFTERDSTIHVTIPNTDDIGDPNEFKPEVALVPNTTPVSTPKDRVVTEKGMRQQSLLLGKTRVHFATDPTSPRSKAPVTGYEAYSRTVPKRVQSPSSQSSASSEAWPIVNEEDYLKAPLKTPEVVVKMPSADSLNSQEVNLDEKSTRTSLNSYFTSPDDRRSGPSSPAKVAPVSEIDSKAQTINEEGSYYSPGPPPPSPELKDNRPMPVERQSPQRPGAKMMSPLLEEETPRTETDSEAPQQHASDYANFAAAEMANLMGQLTGPGETGYASRIQSLHNSPEDGADAEPEITENGGDHAGFKRELREEMERMSREIDN